MSPTLPEPHLDVTAYIATVTPAIRQTDARTLLELFTRVTGQQARMWNASIIGFGDYHYQYASGREGDAAAAGFSPRKAAMSIYLPDGIGAHEAELTTLGPHRSGVGCLYLKNLEQVDLEVLEQIIASSYATVTTGVAFTHRARESGAR